MHALNPQLPDGSTSRKLSSSLLKDGDQVRFRLASRKMSALICRQMALQSNARGIRMRPPKDFIHAAAEGRLFYAVLQRLQLYAGMVLVAPPVRDATGQVEVELATLSVIEPARGHGIASVLALLWVARQLAMEHYHVGHGQTPPVQVEYVAKVLVGNEDGPNGALMGAGFTKCSTIELDPAIVPGVSHMVLPGEDRVLVTCYRFNRAALDKVLYKIHALLERGTLEAGGITLRLEFDRDLINRRALREHVRLLSRDRHGLPSLSVVHSGRYPLVAAE